MLKCGSFKIFQGDTPSDKLQIVRELLMHVEFCASPTHI